MSLAAPPASRRGFRNPGSPSWRRSATTRGGSYRLLIVKAEGGAAVDAALGLIKAALGKA